MELFEKIKEFYEEHKDDLLIGFFILITILLIVLLIISVIKKNVECNCESANTLLSCGDLEEDEEEIEEITTFYVEVKGEVENPGVYSVTSENIINDLIELAGGFTTSAYTNNINLSRKLSSEMVIYVYSKKEYKSLTTTSSTASSTTTTETTTCDCSSYDISNCTTTGASEIVASDTDTTTTGSTTTDTTSTLININTATKEELMTLSGIGESKAASIISYREENGNFATIEDIQNVSGIGSSVFESIKDYITV